MGSQTTPINIGAHGPHGSMAAALRNTSGHERRPSTGGNGHRYSTAAQPISMSNASQNKPRRESLASSMVTGMSWGGASVSSWIRDDIIMQGTSPFTYQSPSFHSSSYAPKLEADFMRDFSCCNTRWDTLHDLLEHYEEMHPQQYHEPNRRVENGPTPDPKAAIATNTAAALKDPSQAHPRPKPITPQRSNTPVQRTSTQASAPNFPSQEEETLGDMEMDDDFSEPPSIFAKQRIMQNHFGRPRPTLDMNAANVRLQHQGLRNSNPTTPVSAGSNRYYQNNPTVSSVNTPTLTAHPSHHPLQKQQFYTPESSTPGTPGELDPDVLNHLSQMNMSQGHMNPSNFDPSGNWGYAPSNEMLDRCIDEPAKRLFQANGLFSSTSSQSQPAQQLGEEQYGENSELARTIREQQKLAGVPDPSADGVPKPFHCPVIGCEKAYKNHNGLKYHKTHGHKTQTLHSNPNGTFSIVDPETLQPYPGTKGMEKHKPYQCQTCGKRYKNLNGLKYHKQHTNVCEKEIRGYGSTTNSRVGSPVGSKRNSLQGSQLSRAGGVGPAYYAAEGEMQM